MNDCSGPRQPPKKYLAEIRKLSHETAKKLVPSGIRAIPKCGRHSASNSTGAEWRRNDIPRTPFPAIAPPPGQPMRRHGTEAKMNPSEIPAPTYQSTEYPPPSCS